MKTASIFLALILGVTACTSTVHRVNNLSPGMTKAEVIAVLGPPDTSMSPGGGVEVLRYKLKKQRLYRLAVPITTEYLVRFVDGRAEAYGTPKDFKSNDKTVNVNLRTDGAVAPVQPNVNIKAN